MRLHVPLSNSSVFLGGIYARRASQFKNNKLRSPETPTSLLLSRLQKQLSKYAFPEKVSHSCHSLDRELKVKTRDAEIETLRITLEDLLDPALKGFPLAFSFTTLEIIT